MTNETNTTVVAPVAAAKTPKPLNVCFCGCGGLTKGNFVPGHDARFHGTVKKVLRGELNAEEELKKLPHDEARAAFLAYADEITPVENARKAKKDAEKAEKEAAKAKKKADAEKKKADEKAEKAKEKADATKTATVATAVTEQVEEKALVA